MKNLQELLEHEMKDLYSAEKQLIDALPDMIKAASDEQLKQAFANHLEETKGQFKKVKQICDMLDINPGSTKCDAMEGLIEEGKDIIKEDAAPAVKDAALIAAAQRVEHYEMAGYGASKQFAKTLGHHDIANILDQILQQEAHADKLLNDLAINKINERAKQGGSRATR